MNQVVLTLLCVLLLGVSLAHSVGQGGGLSQRCLCRGRLLKSVNRGCIRTIEFFPPSPSCSKTEIILTVIAKGKGKGKGKMRKVCLDPNEKQGQRFLKSKEKQKKNNRGKKGKNEKSDGKND